MKATIKIDGYEPQEIELQALTPEPTYLDRTGQRWKGVSDGIVYAVIRSDKGNHYDDDSGQVAFTEDSITHGRVVRVPDSPPEPKGFVVWYKGITEADGRVMLRFSDLAVHAVNAEGRVMATLVSFGSKGDICRIPCVGADIPIARDDKNRIALSGE